MKWREKEHVKFNRKCDEKGIQRNKGKDSEEEVMKNKTVYKNI